MRRLLAVFGLLASFTVQAGEFQPVRDAVVEIMGDKGSCSAVAISPTKLLTAKHCLGALAKGNDTFEITGRPLVARVVAVDAETDLALLELKAGTLKVTVPVCVGTPQIDDRVWLVGFPLHQAQTVTEGILQALDGQYYLASAPGIFGNSGGGLFEKQNGKFCLIGIASWGSDAKGQFVFHMLWSVNWFQIKRFLSESTPDRKEDPSGNRLPGFGKR